MKKKSSIKIFSLLIIILIIGIVVLYQSSSYSKLDDNEHNNINNSIISMLFETAVDSGTYEIKSNTLWPTSGYIFNEEFSYCENGSELSWDGNTNKVVLNSRLQDKCYVYFDMIPVFYWNLFYYTDNIDGSFIPSQGGPDGYHSSREDLQAAIDQEYINEGEEYRFTDVPVYVKSTRVGSNSYNHEVCIFYNNYDMCFTSSYWVQGDSDGSLTLQKLETDIINTLHLDSSSIECDTYCSSFCAAYCYLDDYTNIDVQNGSLGINANRYGTYNIGINDNYIGMGYY